MSTCNKEELYYSDLLKKCSKCGIISLKSFFHKNENMSDALDPRCRKCWRQ